jgi:hypothetical protein
VSSNLAPKEYQQVEKMRGDVICFLLLLRLTRFKTVCVSRKKLIVGWNQTHTKMEVLVFTRFWTIADTQIYSDYLFVFGDNEEQRGEKGQSIIRNQSNVVGIPTKKSPYCRQNAYYSDKEYNRNVQQIDKAIKHIVALLQMGTYRGLVVPQDGWGTGLAKLYLYAPKTLAYINEKMNYITRNMPKHYI